MQSNLDANFLGEIVTSQVVLDHLANTPSSLKFLEQRVHELVGGPLTPRPLRQRCGGQKT